MPESSRCRLVILIVAAAYIIGVVIQSQFHCEPPFESRCLAHKLENKFRQYQEAVFRHAENCTIESEIGDSGVQYLRISCLVDDPAPGGRPRLQSGDHFRNLFSKRRIPNPLMRKWTLRVPRDAVKRLGEPA
ncbi:uncharacterized protein [Drosophila pseudoobscura]|uniref:Uncharacterized protein isoform X2 n=1 Tax=Drosophila pseudoobscura pseudoobscura TaxID=46245 RepID=A0A6I8WB42_DROPS|nr:uncharacterized protein LOC4813023 isoform X2 [Drosophila pseudoobscura]